MTVPGVLNLVGVKNLTGRPADPYACPPAGYLAGRTATFDYAMVSVALWTPDTWKPFKVCRVYDLQPE